MKIKRFILFFIAGIFTYVNMCCAEGISDVRLISVVGEGEIKVVPDEVVCMFGTETMHQDLTQAKAENARRMQALFAVAHEFTIEDKYIRTDYLNIEPRYNHQYQQRDFVGYFVRRNVEITLRDMSKFEDFLSRVLEAGVDQVFGIQFRATKQKEYETEARQHALTDAQQKAQDMAAAFGQKLGMPYSITEQNGRIQPQPRGVMMEMASFSGGAQGSVMPGEITITTQITVSFFLENEVS